MEFRERTDLGKFLSAKEFFDYSYPEVVRSGMPTAQCVESNEPAAIATADYLVAFSSQLHSYCVGCVDMVNSTKISASIPANKLSGYYEIFLNSMS